MRIKCPTCDGTKFTPTSMQLCQLCASDGTVDNVEHATRQLTNGMRQIPFADYIAILIRTLIVAVIEDREHARKLQEK